MTASKEPLELVLVANDEFARRLRLVGPDDWRRPTPCPEWDVRALVNHVVGGCVRHQMLLHGVPTQEVEATRALDHLGANPVAAFAAAADVAVSCFCEDGSQERIVHHAAGDRAGRELLSMRVIDSAVHAWDLARAIGADEALDDDVVAFVLAYTADVDLGPQQRAFAPPDADVPRNASPQDQLLHRLGRHPNITEESRERHQAIPRRDDAAHPQCRDRTAQRRRWSSLRDVVAHRSGHRLRCGVQSDRMGRGRSDVREDRVELLELQLVPLGSGRRRRGRGLRLSARDRTDDRVGTGSEPTPYSLRSTTIFRRENGEWKIVHRHADPVDDSAESLLRRHHDR